MGDAPISDQVLVGFVDVSRVPECAATVINGV